MARVRGAVTPEQLCANLAKGTAAWMAASTPEQRRERALLASRSRTPEETAEYTRRASYQAGRAHLARSIERKRELLAALEAEIKELAL